MARAVCQALAERGWPIDPVTLRNGFVAARWPGRLQQLTWRGIPLLLDGAHNPPAALALRHELDAHPERYGLKPGPRHWVIGMLANKQGPEILRLLLAEGDRAWIVPVPDHASWSCAQLVEACPEHAPDLLTSADLEQAINSAFNEKKTRIILTGSLYLLAKLI